MALIDNLISYWKLDEASGNALDAHGANDLTDTNTVASAAGKISNARDFEATNTEYFTKADNADLSSGDIDLTIAAWVQLESNTTGVIICKGLDITATSGFEYAIYYSSATSRFTFRVRGGATNRSIAADALGAPSTATWYYVVGRHDATANTISISVNAGTVNSVGHTQGMSDTIENFRIGWDGVAARYWDGLIDEAAIWKRNLSDAEVTQLYNGGSGLAYPFTASGNRRRRVLITGA